MNKKILTIIVIIATSISVYFILKPLNNEKDNGANIQVNSHALDKKVADSKKDTKQEDDKKVVKTQEEPAKKAEKEDKEESIPEISSTDNGDISNSSDNKDEKNNEEDALTAAMIFKVDKSTIESKMSLTSKAKLLFYAKRLSNFDFARIKQILASNDEVNGAKEIFRILKSRLNSNEYNEVKNILNPYINTDKIEQYIDT
jgi:hypothetical protein